MTQVHAPCPGRLVPLADVPDPVFAGELVGPGIAIDPDPGVTDVVSPIAGRLVKVHPHAFVVLGADGIGVLVHLGIDTVKLEGAGFEVLAAQGSTVEVGTPVVRWDPATITEHPTVVPVVVLDRPAGSLDLPAGGVVVPGDLLFEVD